MVCPMSHSQPVVKLGLVHASHPCSAVATVLFPPPRPMLRRPGGQGRAGWGAALAQSLPSCRGELWSGCCGRAGGHNLFSPCWGADGPGMAAQELSYPGPWQRVTQSPARCHGQGAGEPILRAAHSLTHPSSSPPTSLSFKIHMALGRQRCEVYWK